MDNPLLSGPMEWFLVENPLIQPRIVIWDIIHVIIRSVVLIITSITNRIVPFRFDLSVPDGDEALLQESHSHRDSHPARLFSSSSPPSLRNHLSPLFVLFFSCSVIGGSKLGFPACCYGSLECPCLYVVYGGNSKPGHGWGPPLLRGVSSMVTLRLHK